MSFDKGKEKTGGRKKGTPNRATKEMRDLLKAIFEDELEALPSLLSELKPKDRLDFIIKLAPYVLPKLQSIDMEYGEPFTMWS